MRREPGAGRGEAADDTLPGEAGAASAAEALALKRQRHERFVVQAIARMAEMAQVHQRLLAGRGIDADVHHRPRSVVFKLRYRGGGHATLAVVACIMTGRLIFDGSYTRAHGGDVRVAERPTFDEGTWHDGIFEERLKAHIRRHARRTKPAT